ncbi:MAG: 6,7-dimethyl-8-ribityllumazine synthase [Candidatus Eisenbacteria bacterium]
MHRRPEADANGLRFCLVAAQWNEAIVNRLVEGALGVLAAQGARDEDIEVRWVPGSFELPVAAFWAAGSGEFDAVLAFGCVIRGETEHFRIVADAAAQGLLRVALDTGVPVLNGVLATYDAAQAESRAGGEHGNTGSQTALAAIRMARAAREAGTR